MSSEIELKEIYDYVEPIVASAGQYMRQGYELGSNKSVETKSAFFDLVTIYDKNIEDMLVNGIKAKYPHHKFIGEEESAKNKSKPIVLTNEPTWIIDPIDGTTNFIRKIPHACISIGLAVNQELVLGIIYNPSSNEMYTARKNHGAFLNGTQISVNKNCKKLNDAVISIEISLIHAESVRDKILKRLYKLGSKATGSRGFGSAALAMCYVACGQIDLYQIDDLQPWDMAAGVVIVREAGGLVLNPKGGVFDIMKPDVLCTTTQELADEAVQLIEEANDIPFTFV